MTFIDLVALTNWGTDGEVHKGLWAGDGCPFWTNIGYTSEQFSRASMASDQHFWSDDEWSSYWKTHYPVYT